MIAELDRAAIRWLCFLVAILIAASLAFLAGKVWLAEHWNASPIPARWLRAANLEPGDAQYWTHLGLYRPVGIDHAALLEAIASLQRAAETEPLSAQRWMNLADACHEAGQLARAQLAYERAQANYPISTEIAWHYGSFLLDEGRLAPAYRELRRALGLQPGLTAAAISECWQKDPDVAPLVNDVLPANSDAYLAALDFFVSHGLLDAALAVWNRQLQLRLPVKMVNVIPLVDALIGGDRIADAKLAWVQALQAANGARDLPGKGSLVYNSGFEYPIVNGGFDWREIPSSGIRFSLDSRDPHSGLLSLRIEFDGTANRDFQGLLQYVPVCPVSRYRFSAWLRTDDLSTDSGIRFRIFDPRHPSQTEVLTPNLIGTNPWTLIEAVILTRRDTDLLEIALRRLPSRKFDNRICGSVWIDDVALAVAGSISDGSPR